MRKLLGVVAVSAMAIAAAASSHAQGKKYVFALVPKNMNNP
ncbi:MAG: sugar ABC transporter substrate-binding protein, partial [Hyphomicrobiales bacterium]|nr:sugar ABC transporter substrate-binding protein [Hyphomicrobiales bacterium]